jgi:hypothetical protein
MLGEGGLVRVSGVEEVLDGGDRRDGLRLRQVRLVDVAEAEVADQPLLAQRGQDLEPLAQRLSPGRHAPADPQVHQVKAVCPERIQVRLHGGADAGGSALRGSVGAEDGTDLGRDDQPRRVREQGLADEVVGAHCAVSAAVEVGGVDVIHAELGRAPQHRPCRLRIAGRGVPHPVPR